MSDIAGELARVQEAFEKPTLKLLERMWAPFIIAVFKSSFSRDQQSVPADRLHMRVDGFLGELRSIGRDVPVGSGRDLCLQWMHSKWLSRSDNPAGGYEYALTSNALEAMALVDSLTRDRALISESRLKMILQTVRQWAAEANAVREDRIRRLEEQIDALSRERDRLVAGGEIYAASDDRMIDGYSNLIDLISQLPSDFRRVEEAVAGMHRAIVEDFRDDLRPIGLVLDEYLARSDELMTSTAEGRAFEGALELLRDDGLLLDLSNDLQTILDHPFSAALTPSERRDFRGTVTVIRKGTYEVLDRRTHLTTTLREHIVNHDRVKERELEELLRGLQRELGVWMQSARPRTTVPIELIPPGLDMSHLRERFYDPGGDVMLPPVRDVSAAAPPTPSLEELRRQGGPRLQETKQAIVDAAIGEPAGTMGEAFNTLDNSLRRPVEILGLLHLATQAGALPNTDAGTPEVEPFEAIRPDGTRRTFDTARVPLDQESIAALAALPIGPDA